MLYKYFTRRKCVLGSKNKMAAVSPKNHSKNSNCHYTYVLEEEKKRRPVGNQQEDSLVDSLLVLAKVFFERLLPHVVHLLRLFQLPLD